VAPHGEGIKLTPDIFQLGFRQETIREKINKICSLGFQVLPIGLPDETANVEFQRTPSAPILKQEALYQRGAALYFASRRACHPLTSGEGISLALL